jgi:hypothetical protein
MTWRKHIKSNRMSGLSKEVMAVSVVGDVKKVLSVRDLFRCLRDFTGQQAVPAKRNDRHPDGVSKTS